MNYHDVARRLANTFISDLPGVRVIHSLISEFVEWKHQLTAGEEWIEYNEARLYADTSDHVAKALAIHGQYEPQVHKSINNHLDKGDIAIDVGSHIGHHTVTMRQCVGSSGKVWAFEPNPENIDYLNKTLRENGWTNVELFPFALSNIEVSNELVVPDSSNTGGATLRDTNMHETNPNNKYNIETKKLTSVLNEEDIDDIKLLKIDVEGGETDIIKDLRNHLNKIEIIIMEFHTQMLSREEVRDTFDILNNSGEIIDFNGDIVDLERVLREKTTIVWKSQLRPSC